MTKKKIILIVLITFCFFILFGLLSIYGPLYLYSPIPEYQKSESINHRSICERIEDSQLQELCFNIIEKENFMVGGIILPFPPIWSLNGIIQALPTHFSDTFPRKAIGTRSWFLVKDFQKYKGKGWVDEEKGWGVIIKEERNE